MYGAYSSERCMDYFCVTPLYPFCSQFGFIKFISRTQLQIASSSRRIPYRAKCTGFPCNKFSSSRERETASPCPNPTLIGAKQLRAFSLFLSLLCTVRFRLVFVVPRCWLRQPIWSTSHVHIMQHAPRQAVEVERKKTPLLNFNNFLQQILLTNLR